jgi:CheY-like chemotaxis protein
VIERVLLVDDEPDIRRVGALALRATAGWSVTEVSTGVDALAQATECCPDVILLDVMMPGMDGPETLCALRRLPELADKPIIFLTAKVQPSEVQRYLSLGAAGVISKPFDPMTFANQVRDLVG